jgi:colanic acid biosynthesis glycosyl transferase WcaI
VSRVLILTLVFPPDNVSTAQLMADLALDLQRAGHSVEVLTTLPHYNRDEVAVLKQPMQRAWFGLLWRSNFCGIGVYHVWMPKKGRNKIYRILTWIGFHLIGTVAGLTKVRSPDVILSPSPPLTIGLAAWFLAFWQKARYIYNVQELYPDVAINLGALKNRWIIELLYRMERFVYRKSAAVTVISPRMRTRVLEKGISAEKVLLIPNFVDVDGFVPATKNNEFSLRHHLQAKFVVIYAGNMGVPQHLEVLLAAASQLRDERDIRILLMGNGSERERLERLAEELRLENVQILPQQPYAVMPEAYAASDLAYVPQALGTSNDGIPSKVYRILASGRPVLACTDQDSDLARLIEEASAGVVVTAGTPNAIAEAIRSAADDPSTCRVWGANGRAHVVQNYRRDLVSASYSRLVTQVSGTAEI